MRRFCKKSVSPVLALVALVLILLGLAAGDSLNIRLAGEWPFSGLTSVIGVASRNLAFVGSGGGVYVLDISNPDTPQVLSMKIQPSGTVNDMFYESGTQRLYVAGQQSGLSIWDVSTATNPQRLGVCRTPSQAYRVVVSGGYAYVADRDSGLRIINVSTPANPYQAGRYVTSGDVQGIAVSGSYAYVGDGNYLRVINVSDPANPYQTGACDSLVTLGIAQADSFVYVVNGYSGLIVVNVADPTHPYRMGQCPPKSYAVDIALRGHYAYVADDMFGYLVIDISDPWNPRDTWSMAGGGRSWVRVSDTLAFFIGDDVDINDASVPTRPLEVGCYSPLSLGGSCAVSGQYAYVGSDHGLLVFDISDVQNPLVVDTCPVGADDIALQNQYAYVTWGNLFAVLDISDPASPHEEGRCSFRDAAVRIAVSGTLACVLGQNSLLVIDVSRPDSPFVTGILWGSTWGGVVMRDSFAYVANVLGNCLQVVSLADPANPVEVGHLTPPDIPWDLAVFGGFAYVADGDSGLVIADVTDPTHPVEVGEYPVPGEALHVSAFSGGVYVAGYWTTLRLLDVSNPANPNQVGFYDNFGVPVDADMVPVGRYLYVAGPGLDIYEDMAYGIEEPKTGPVASSSVRLLENPIRGREIALEIRNVKYGAAAFRLFNVVGEQVKQYRLTGLGSGTNVVRLPVDGLAAGLYILRTNEPQNHCGIKAVIGK